MTARLCPQGLRASNRVQATGENPDPGGDHLFVEHVDIAPHRFVLGAWREVIRVMNGNQKLRHDSSP
jgi:hypothetical protein